MWIKKTAETVNNLTMHNLEPGKFNYPFMLGVHSRGLHIQHRERDIIHIVMKKRFEIQEGPNINFLQKK
ncbi:hypothetical protein MASR2M39_19140 [Ignavibacteriales bacterium]